MSLIEKKLAKGMSVARIAEDLEERVEVIEKLIKEIEAGPESD